MARQFDMETETFRVSFPYLSQPNKFNDNENYQVDAIFDPQTANMMWTNIVTQAQAMLAQEFPGREQLFQWPSMKDGNTNIAKSDPAQNVKNGYAGQYYMSLKSHDPVGCVRFDAAMGMDMNIDPKQVYSGCYARAFIQIWLQDNSYGQRVNIKLLAIKFISDGESLGGAAPIDPLTAFSQGQAALPPGAQVAGAVPMQAVHTEQHPQQGYYQGQPTVPIAAPIALGVQTGLAAPMPAPNLQPAPIAAPIAAPAPQAPMVAPVVPQAPQPALVAVPGMPPGAPVPAAPGIPVAPVPVAVNPAYAAAGVPTVSGTVPQAPGAPVVPGVLSPFLQ